MADPASDAAAAALQLEASAHLAALCQPHPALVATVLAEAAAQVPQLAATSCSAAAAASRLLAALAPLPVERWEITSQQLGALAHLMSEGHLGAPWEITSQHLGASAPTGQPTPLLPPALSPATKPAPAATSAAATSSAAAATSAAAAAEGGDDEWGETRRRDLAS